MNDTVRKIENWLANDFTDNNDYMDEAWQPDFDADLQLVISKVGGYEKVFIRPKRFSKRFYHTLIPLSIEEWQCTDQVKLYDGFCTLDITLRIRFQATFEYARSNMEIVTELNAHIQERYQGLVMDIVNRELLNLSDGSWVQQGLSSVEKKISILISEMLILQNIQSQVICRLKSSFEEFPDVQFAKENVYLCVLKKSFEFEEQQTEETFNQQQSQEKQKIEHKRQQFKYLSEIAELDRQKQALHAENNKRLLEDKELQQLEEYKVRKKIHLDKIRHNKSLKEIALIEELKEQDRRQTLVREHDEQEKIKQIAHQMKLKEKALDSEITEYQREQEHWRSAKSKSHAQELDQKNQQRQLEFDTEVGYKQRYELQRIALQEESYSVRKNADLYLKREIELLELEKKRMALQLTIKEFKDKQKPDIIE